MRYERVITGTFINRPNRFIAEVEIDGNTETVHVKNTGRGRELRTGDAGHPRSREVFGAEGKDPRKDEGTGNPRRRRTRRTRPIVPGLSGRPILQSCRGSEEGAGDRRRPVYYKRLVEAGVEKKILKPVFNNRDYKTLDKWAGIDTSKKKGPAVSEVSETEET